MSDERVFTLSWKHHRSALMLYALHYANTFEEFPTITEMARAHDPRTTIPRTTIASRRVMLRNMMRAGFIHVHHVDDQKRNRYAITRDGIAELERYRREVRG